MSEMRRAQDPRRSVMVLGLGEESVAEGNEGGPKGGPPSSR